MPILQTQSETHFLDQITPIGLYLALRDQFAGCLLLESSEHKDKTQARSILCAAPLAGIRLFQTESQKVRIETFLHQQLQSQDFEALCSEKSSNLRQILHQFFETFQLKEDAQKDINGFFGFQSFEAIRFFENEKANLDLALDNKTDILNYQLFRYVICFNHFNGEVTFTENKIENSPQDAHFQDISLSDFIHKLLKQSGKTYPFQRIGEEKAVQDESYFLEMVKKAQAHCQRGDVFQMVVSRHFYQGFQGDEFNLYRALRHINPSPYMFYFDYGNYKIFGSSPEAQIRIVGGEALVNPIAGTYKRTGDKQKDEQLGKALLADPKEVAEHAMLVDLARNDLNRHCEQVQVLEYKAVHQYSHVIHLVSTVKGKLAATTEKGLETALNVLADTFPAGTLSGAPKVRALQLLAQLEQDARGFYGGSLGFIDFKGEVNQAILIRSFLSYQNQIHYRAGAGVVLASVPEQELQEVANKLGALRRALAEAEKLSFSSPNLV
ncbi:anthranilate synthase component I family protein [Hugenholtzia roseola]|uniref:anthranilate synthase component I family protein n=1 Tax=Hugenholtzia roseola TaxID=1002 RepID=UPI00041D0D8C|nr:anthranilate synthase component I family protein [Hugenholtzia roseola]